MLPLRQWFAPRAPSPPGPDIQTALLEAVSRFRPDQGRPLDFTATVGLDDGRGNAWTASFERAGLSVFRGCRRDVDVTISGDPLTLAGLVRGDRSGAEAFLHGRL